LRHAQARAGIRTLGKEAIVASLGVLAQEPAIAKVVVALNQLDAVPAPETELVGTPRQKLVCSSKSVFPQLTTRPVP
jgi:hypothetical protein